MVESPSGVRPHPATATRWDGRARSESPESATATGERGLSVTVYWRPGCPYCSGLRRRLRQLGVRTTEVNIWHDSEAAALVRSQAGGNETVPTVVVGGTAMVNPSGSEVLELARRLTPGAIDESGALSDRRGTRATGPVPMGKAVVIVTLVASLALDGFGHPVMGWATDGVGLSLYLALPALRRPTVRREAR